MKYLLLVCWDADRMNADTEPIPTPGEAPHKNDATPTRTSANGRLPSFGATFT